jgi:RNA polymerase sigma factor (sigma-70 family)
MSGFDLVTFAEWKKTGNKKLESKLIADNDLLVRQQVAKLCRIGHITECEDLIQAARIGLLIALRKYDPVKAAFSTYAAHWIRDQFQQCHIHLDREIYRPKGYGVPYPVLRKMEAIQAKEGREATGEELGISEDKLARWRCDAMVTMSLDGVRPGACDLDSVHNVESGYDGAWSGGHNYAGDGPDPEGALEVEEGCAMAVELLRDLPPKERTVLTALYLEERGILRVAAELRMSPNDVMAIRDAGLARLREDVDA